MDANKNKLILERLKESRKKKGYSIEEIARRVNIGPDWIEAIETNQTIPTFEMVTAIADASEVALSEVISSVEQSETANTLLSRSVIAIQDGDDLNLGFQYNDHEAVYKLPNATKADYDDLLVELRQNSYDPSVTKTDFVINLFFKAIQLWPHANPSDIWGFFLSRLYQDPYNHPVSERNRDYAQSWKRTSGWVLERIIVAHYRQALIQKGITIDIYPLPKVKEYLQKMNLNYHDVEEKADVLVINTKTDECFGVIHVKASLAERRQADQSFSQALLGKQYLSPFVTMDCKSTPSASPYNKGEFGPIKSDDADLRTNKRLDFEEEGYFTACYSYNTNTIPTPANQKATARIHVLDFSNPNDEFYNAVVRSRDNLFSG